MPHNTLIKDGHAEPADAYENLPNVEAFLASNQGEKLHLSNDADLTKIELQLPNIKVISVEFPNFADGRGFSIARELRKKYGYKGLLIADGPLIPDQYVFALQCGFDAVKVDEETYGPQSESDWFEAMDAFKLTYQRGYAMKNGPEVNVFDARRTSVHADKKNDPYFGLSAEQTIRRAIKEFGDKLVLASSMGADSAVLLHLTAQVDKDVPIIFLDTYKHFRETLHYRDMLIEDLGLTNFQNITPDETHLKTQDLEGNLYQTQPDQCCEIRKVLPLAGALGKYEARITGRKRYQTPDRRDMPIYEVGSNMIKINPLAYWTAKDVSAYMRKHDLASHPMLSLGFLSIGCQPCTTRVADGEDPRAGRWRHFDKNECGIHYIDGRWQKVDAKRTFETF
ncbi:MAG: phosphoadenylyl-sulfate reductase [Maricaulaceae bacterium]